MSNLKYDLWSDGYVKPVQFQNDSDEYPFAGYSTVLEEMYNMIRETDAKKILDVGFGTGLVMRKLHQDGYDLCGLDISQKIVDAGKEDMPNAKLYVADCPAAWVRQIPRCASRARPGSYPWRKKGSLSSQKSLLRYFSIL